MNALTIDLASGSSAEDQATSYVLKGLQFVGKAYAQKYIRAKMAIVSPAPGRVIEKEDIDRCRILARKFNFWRNATELDIDAQEVAEFVCGMSPIRMASPTKIQELADAHGLSFERASEMLKASQVQMAHSIISKHGHKVGQCLTWLAEIDKFGDELEENDAHEVEEAIAVSLREQYKRAAGYTNLISKYIIESYAKEWSITLPRWGDLLPAWGKDSSLALEQVQKRQMAYADAIAASQQEAERNAVEQYGDF